MVGVGEHVDGLHTLHAIEVVEQAKVASLCGRVATHIDYAPWRSKADNVHHIAVHAGAGRVGDDDIGSAVVADKVCGEDVFHVAGIKERVVEPVKLGVDFSVGNGFGHILNAHHLTGLSCHKVGDGARAGIEVVDQLIAAQTGKVAGHLIKFVGTGRVGLIKTLRTHLEPQTFHLGINAVCAAVGDDGQVGKGVVAFRVVDVEQRRHLGESRVQMVEQVVSLLVFVGSVDAKLHEQHQFARRGIA